MANTKRYSDPTLQRWLEAGQATRVNEHASARLAADPNDGPAWYWQGICWWMAGKQIKAQSALKRATRLAKHEPRYWAGLAALLMARENHAPALKAADATLALKPDHAPALATKADALLHLEKPREALACAEQLAALEPKVPRTQQLMADVLRKLAQEHAALSWLSALEQSAPDTPTLPLDRALCWAHLGQPEQALSHLKPLLTDRRTTADNCNQFGIRAQNGASPHLALQCFKRALELEPDNLTALVNTGVTVQAMGHAGETLYFLNKAIELAPDYAPPWYHAALSHHAMRNLGKAIDSLENCLKADGHHTDAMVMLASLYKDKGKLDQAKGLLRDAIAQAPDSFQAYLNLAQFLLEASEFEDAAAVLDEAETRKMAPKLIQQTRASLLLKRGNITQANKLYRDILLSEPDNPDAMSGLLFCSNYDPELKPEQIADAYRSWDRRFVAWRSKGNKTFGNTTQPHRRIRLGYVSGDFKQHSVSFFSQPLLANHDHSKFEVYCYANQKHGDRTTQRMMAMADHWRWIHDLSDEAAAEMIRMDKIDILIDLSNHTALHRLYLFGLKPAPIQMTTLGMPTTTGMSAIDYRITDKYMDPPGLTEHLHAEKLLRIESGWCYRPSDDGDGMGVSVLPAAANGYITFASFNAFGKINPNVFKLWGQLLKAIPNARLVVATGGKEGDAALNEQVNKTCKASGVPLKRLILMPRLDFKDYLAYHHKVDVVLDAFPYTGATVTAHALWMGVPVITLAGKSPIHRSATSMMNVVGLPEFVAQTKDEYIAIAKRCASDLDGLAAVRQNLRTNMEKSALMDGKRVTQDLEKKLRKVWSDWCKQQPTTSTDNH